MVTAWRLAEPDADALLAAWESEAEGRGMRPTDPGYWSAAEPWLEARRTIR